MMKSKTPIIAVFIGLSGSGPIFVFDDSKAICNQTKSEMSDSPQPHLRFLHSEELREKTIEVLDKLEQTEDPTQCRDALGDLVVELTHTGLDYFFIKPLELAKVGFIPRQSANLGMTGARKVMGTMIRRIIGGMDKDQLLIISGYIRQLMH